MFLVRKKFEELPKIFSYRKKKSISPTLLSPSWTSSSSLIFSETSGNAHIHIHMYIYMQYILVTMVNRYNY